MAAKKHWKSLIRKYIQILRREISVDRVIVFGSYARGRPKPYSDIDVAIFSRNFRDRDEIANMQFLFKKTREVDTSIEPHPFHPKDLKQAVRGSLLAEILRTGKVLV